MRPILLLVTAIALLLVGGIASAARSSKRMGDEERGKLLYERHCIQCHGDAAGGDGAATQALVVPVPSLRGALDYEDVDKYVPLVLDGRGGMPGYETSFDKYDAKRVLRHMAKIAQGDAVPEKKAPDPVRDTGGDAPGEQEDE